MQEYDRLKEIERSYNEMVTNKEGIFITTGNAGLYGSAFYGYSSVVKIINYDEAMKLVMKEGNQAVEKLNNLRRKKVPVFNWPGTTVMDLD